MTYRFKLLRGIHSAGQDAEGVPRVFYPGDTFESPVDLSASQKNVPKHLWRYELLGAGEEVEEEVEEGDTLVASNEQTEDTLPTRGRGKRKPNRG